ncbi:MULTISPECIES: LIC10604 family protein [Leptospira]|uniref:Polyketide cyclase n=2 Tax=Leptospira kirschneri TaxID=29507 RepID=A0A1T1DII0_9LEPT|nr:MULTISPECIES: SRPBCC family protein [Leptospira]EKO13350.1 polyketide cyclase/dehydrase and lipid transport [Leptospira kirschneri str. H1]EKO59131.1 polyketide cyclase/dehydrase and lipid transport [Leptospira kirschneri str. H2]EMK08741.1 polyketide cyclase/dehydrase and lipid transport [Leptospira kirschneri]KXZ28736.1 polyketide cyclase [Leptospira kirschneri]KXZ33526.1 polyketide cyclase [Leptospira sp. ZV016]
MVYRILIYIMVFLVLLILTIYGVGASLPVEHSVFMERIYKVPPENVYSLIRDFKQYPFWRRNVKKVEEISSTSWKETDIHEDVITFSFIQDRKNMFLESKIMDEDKPFGGSWTYELSSVSEGTKLKITENGKVYSPVFRFFSKFVFGHSGMIKEYLDFIDQKIWETQKAR